MKHRRERKRVVLLPKFPRASASLQNLGSLPKGGFFHWRDLSVKCVKKQLRVESVVLVRPPWCIGVSADRVLRWKGVN